MELGKRVVAGAQRQKIVDHRRDEHSFSCATETGNRQIYHRFVQRVVGSLRYAVHCISTDRLYLVEHHDFIEQQ